MDVWAECALVLCHSIDQPGWLKIRPHSLHLQISAESNQTSHSGISDLPLPSALAAFLFTSLFWHREQKSKKGVHQVSLPDVLSEISTSQQRLSHTPGCVFVKF